VPQKYLQFGVPRSGKVWESTFFLRRIDELSRLLLLRSSP